MAKKDKKSKGSSKSTVVDFSDMIEGEGGKWIKRVPEGVFFPFKITGMKKEMSSNDNPMLVITFQGLSGKVRGRNTRDRFVLQPNSLWKLRNLIEAMGQKFQKKKMTIEHSTFVGKEVGISFLDDEYNDKITSKPDEYGPIDEATGEESKGGKKKDKGGGGKKGKKGKKGKDSLEDLDLEGI